MEDLLKPKQIAIPIPNLDLNRPLIYHQIILISKLMGKFVSFILFGTLFKQRH